MSDIATITPALLTPAQAADYLGMSRTTLDQLTADGRIGPRPQRLSPRLVRWRRAELDEWIAAGMLCRSEWDERRESRQ